MKQRTEAFGPDDHASGVDCRAVVVAGVEEGIVVSALQLKARFQHFRRHVCGCSSKITEEACLVSVGENSGDSRVIYRL